MASSSLRSTEEASCPNTPCADCNDDTIGHFTHFGAVPKRGQQSVLMKAVGNGHDKCVEALIKSGVDVNTKDKDGWTAVMSAAVRGETRCLRS